MKYSPSKGKQTTSHPHWKLLLFLLHTLTQTHTHFTLATCWMEAGRGLQAELLLTGATPSERDERSPRSAEGPGHSPSYSQKSSGKTRQDTGARTRRQLSWCRNTANGLEAGEVLCLTFSLVVWVWGLLWIFRCFAGEEKKVRREKGRRKDSGTDHWPSPTDPIPFRSCRHFPTDLCHLAADLHSGTSSMWNAAVLRGLGSPAKWRENENEMIWASLLILVSALSSAQSHLSPLPSPPLRIIIHLLHPLIPPTSLTLLLLLLPSLPPPLGNQCALSFRGTRRHIDLAACTHARGHAAPTHTHTHAHTHRGCVSHTHKHTHAHTLIWPAGQVQ